MFDFHEKRKIRDILYSKVVIFLMFAVSALFLVSVYDRYTVAREMKAKLEAKNVELENLKLRAEALGSKVEYLENERGIEEELRNRFDVAREGEKVVILLRDKKEDGGDSSDGDTPPSEGERKEVEEKSFFDFLKFW